MAGTDAECPLGGVTTQTGVSPDRWVASDAVAGGYWFDLSRHVLLAHLDLSPADLDARLTLYAARAARGESVADGTPDPTAALPGVVCWCCGVQPPQCCRLANVGWEVRTVWTDAYQMGFAGISRFSPADSGRTLGDAPNTGRFASPDRVIPAERLIPAKPTRCVR